MLVVLESGLGGDSAEDLLRGLLPGDRFLTAALLLVTKEAHIDKNLDEFWEACVS